MIEQIIGESPLMVIVRLILTGVDLKRKMKKGKIKIKGIEVEANIPDSYFKESVWSCSDKACIMHGCNFHGNQKRCHICGARMSRLELEE